MKKRKSSGPARSVSHEADFKKIKRKVGKKAPLKANVTNTSFATKTIHVPNQKMSVDNTVASRDLHNESSSITNARSMNLHDLFGQMKHYNVNVRRDALIGLKDLLQRHPSILSTESASLFQIIMPALLDEDKSVRTSLLALLSFMLPQLGPTGVSPFQGLLVSYVCSGLSHMHYAVKRSALQCLKSIMDIDRVPSSSGSSSKSSASNSGAMGFLLWRSSHAQLLPNLLSCMSERVFVAKQANIATTEALASKGKESASASASNSAGNLANRAAMLQCIEQFLALCPYSNQADASEANAHAATSDSITTSIAPCLLHSSSLHSLLYPDPNSTAGAEAPVADASHIVVGSKPVPMKYARKNASQMKFYSAPTAASTSEPAPKVAPALNTFISQLLPLSVEYWLESFGLASNSAGGVGGAAGNVATSKNAPAELIANLQSLLRLMRLSMDILRAQKRESRRNELIESGANAAIGEDTAYGPEVIGLPAGFSVSVRTHLFTSFPFTVDHLGPSASVAAASGKNEHLARLLHALNAECVGLMAGFLSPHTGGADTAAAAPVRRKSMTHRSQKQATEDESWLSRIIDYMAAAFNALTEVSQAKAEARQNAFAQSQADAPAEEDVDMMDSAAAESAVAPSPPPRNSSGRPPSTKKGRKSASSHVDSAPHGLEHGSLSDLLPLLQTLLPRLPLARQQWLMEAFLSYYLHCHPLSNSKLACLRFLNSYLLSPALGLVWFRSESLRRTLIDEGEWTGLIGVIAAAIDHQRQMQAGDAAADATASTGTDTPLTPLLQRYFDMIELLCELMLNAGRIFHGAVLDYNVMQDQLVSLFGIDATTESDSSSSSRVVPGPFWSLPVSVQHRLLQLIYYFDSLSPSLLRVLIECMRDHTTDGFSEVPTHVTIAIESKQLVLDMLSERHAVWTGGLPSYVAFILGMVRSDMQPHRTEEADKTLAVELDPRDVSPLLPVACRMLRGISDSEIEDALGTRGTAGEGMLINMLAPSIAECIESSMAGASAKLDLYSSLLLLDSLLSSGVPLPPVFGPLLPRALWQVLASTITGSAVESGVVHTPSQWLHASPDSFLGTQPWLVAMRLLVDTSSTNVMADLLKMMRTQLQAGGTSGRDSALQVVVVITSFVKCVGLRTLLHRHKASVLQMSSTIGASSGLASQTLLAALHAEVTLIFGQQAERR